MNSVNSTSRLLASHVSVRSFKEQNVLEEIVLETAKHFVPRLYKIFLETFAIFY